MFFCALCVGDANAGAVLILPFENRSKQPGLDWIGESIVQSLGDRLRAPERYVFGREERAAAFDQLGVPPAFVLSHATVFKLGELTGAEWVVIGDFVAGEQITIHTQLLEMKRGRLSRPLEESGRLTDLLQIQDRLAAAIAKASGMAALSPPQRPIRLEAWESYIRGLQATEAAQQSKLFRDASRMEPAFSQPAFQLGKIQFHGRDYRNAAVWLGRIQPDDPGYLEANFMLGLAYFQLREFEKAENAFRAVTERLPLAEAFNDLGVVQSRLGKKTATESFAKAIESDPAEPDYSFNLAYSYWRGGEYAQAVRYFRDTMAKNPGDTDARALLKSSLDHLNQVFEKGREIARPGAADPLNQLDRLKRNYEEPGFRQLRMALQSLREDPLASLAPPEHAAAHLQRAKRLMEDPGQATQAIEELNEAARINNKDSEPWVLLARIYIGQGKRSEAREAVRQALERDPASPAAQALLRTLDK